MHAQALFLLIEDNENDVLLIRRAFHQAKMLNPLIVLRRAEDAVEYFLGEGKYSNRAEFPLPDLVLLDLKMPGMDGFEFLKWLRSQPGFGSVRVTVLTSSGLDRDITEARRLGANSYLVKPVDFEKFVEISRALSGYWLWLDHPPDVQRPEVPEGATSWRPPPPLPL